MTDKKKVQPGANAGYMRPSDKGPYGKHYVKKQKLHKVTEKPVPKRGPSAAYSKGEDYESYMGKQTGVKPTGVETQRPDEKFKAFINALKAAFDIEYWKKKMPKEQKGITKAK